MIACGVARPLQDRIDKITEDWTKSSHESGLDDQHYCHRGNDKRRKYGNSSPRDKGCMATLGEELQQRA